MPGMAVSLLAALVLAACGGGGSDGGNSGSGGNGSDPGTGGGTPGTGKHALTLQLKGLPAGASVPLTYGSQTVNWSGSAGLTIDPANHYTVSLGRPALSESSQYLTSCAFAEPLRGTLQSDGSLLVALNADATQVVQCSRQAFAVLSLLKENGPRAETGLRLMLMQADGSQGRWLPGDVGISRSGSSAEGNKALLLNNEILLSGRDADRNSATGYELRATDGTLAGLRLVKDINTTQSDDISSRPTNFHRLADKVYFIASPLGSLGTTRLFVSDGTEQGTQVVSLGGAELQRVGKTAVAGGRLYFDAKNMVYMIDPKTAEPVALDRKLSGELYVLGESVFFQTSDRKYWLHDGTTLSQQEFPPAIPSLGRVMGLDGLLYFSASASGNDYQLWQSDGTVAGTTVVPIHPSGSPSPQMVGVFKGALYFWATDGAQTGLWKLAGKQAKPEFLAAAQRIDGWSVLQDRVVFLSDNNTLWSSDGSRAGTQILKNSAGRSFKTKIRPIVVSEQQALLSVHEDAGQDHADIYLSNGTPEGTVQVKDTYGNPFQIYSERMNAVAQ
ncbi:hypothetical protein [Kerstersia sp.]|uniref:hypothetical protein n=1 Tax=Kerstersia sp. TaxID=1930783 RepID=UPI003F90DF30